MREALRFDPVKYKETTREQWQEAAGAFPAPAVVNGTNYSWAVRVDKNGLADEFNVVVLCVDQWNP